MSRLSLWFVGIAISFSINSMAQSPVPVDALYLKNLDNFHRGMTRWKLKNFVPLVGLHILKEGDNTFGSGSGNDIVLNTQNAPEVIGTITKKGSELTYTAFGELKPELDGNVVSRITYTFDDDHNSEKIRDKFI
ncbi:MAG: hypothetical protein OEW75_18910, partial [Cyclobacteriaceae bacterium]|nr:hypothetical protein [Cyclobacteriaceae bacterium]